MAIFFIKGRQGYRANAWEMLDFLGVKRLPPEGMPERRIQDVRVYVRPLPRKTQPHRNWQGLRVIAICDDCEKHIAVGRMHQHKCPNRNKGDVTKVEKRQPL